LFQAAEAKDFDRGQQIGTKAVPNINDYVRDVATFRRLQQELLAVAE
jgi:hypothetical protein